MKTAAEIGSTVTSRSGLRIIPGKNLQSTEQISTFLRKEIEELQSSDEEWKEIRVGIIVGEADRATIAERVVTLKLDGDRDEVVVEGLLKNPVTLPTKRNLVSPVQLLSDEISGTYEQKPF